MLHAGFAPLFGPTRLHVPEITCDAHDNLPMLEERGEPLPTDLLLLADHSPFGRYDARVLAPGTPFRVTLLREPIDRLESYFHFCARAGFIPAEWAEFTAHAEEMPEAILDDLCRHFRENSSAVTCFDPDNQKPSTAEKNLLSYDVIARHDDWPGFCERFNDRNPYGVRFEPSDVIHINPTGRPSRLTSAQRAFARERLVRDVWLWERDAVQGAMNR